MTSPGGPNHLLAQISPDLSHKTNHTHKNLNMPSETRSNQFETEEKLALIINTYKKNQFKNIKIATKTYNVHNKIVSH